MSSEFSTDQINYLIERDAEVLLHPVASIEALLQQGPTMTVSGEGSQVVDAAGHTLLDAVGGLWCVNAGYRRRELSQAMADASQKLAYYHTFGNATNPWQVALADRLLAIAPPTLGKVFFGSGGSDANDSLIKIAWHYHAIRGDSERVKIIARDQAYHGTSIATASLTGLPSFHRGFPLPLNFVRRVSCPHYYLFGLQGETEEDYCDRLVSELETMIIREGPETIAAFIAEPIMGAGGVIDPPVNYFPKVQAVLKKYGILLIADEVVCGFGRTGSWFASTQMGIEPDMMATAKGLTSGYFPMSAAFISDAIWQTLLAGAGEFGGFYHGYTYSGHPTGAAVALANIDILESECLVDNARDVGDYLHRKLRDDILCHPHVGEIRGRGLLAGIQLVVDKDTKTFPEIADKWPAQVSSRARELGVIVRPLATVGSIAISPPLIFTRDDVDTLVNAVMQSLEVLG